MKYELKLLHDPEARYFLKINSNSKSKILICNQSNTMYFYHLKSYTYLLTLNSEKFDKLEIVILVTFFFHRLFVVYGMNL